MKSNRSMSLQIRAHSNKSMDTQPNISSKGEVRNRGEKQNRSRSQSLERQQKFPPPLTPIRVHSTHEKQIFNSKKVDVIQEKSQVEEDQNLQQMIQEIQSSCHPYQRQHHQQQEKQSSHRQIHFQLHNLSPLPFSQIRSSGMQQEQSPDPQDISKQLEVIQQCVIFWKRQQYNELDLKIFQELIKKYILIHVRPAALNRFGQKLLKNGFFVIAFIKYMTSRNVDSEIRTMMFQMFKNEYVIDRNYQQFQQAYNNNLRISSNCASEEENSSKSRIYNFLGKSQISKGQDSQKRSGKSKVHLKRRLSQQFSVKDFQNKSRQKHLRKQYKNIEYIVVKSVVSCALGNLREFILTQTSNQYHQSPQYILIPKKKQQTINIGSLAQAMKQSEQITKSTNIYFFSDPGNQFNHIYSNISQCVK